MVMRITNEVLLEKIIHIHEDIQEVKVELTNLNGKVIKNSEFRIRQTTLNKMLWAVISTSGISIIAIVTKLVR